MNLTRFFLIFLCVFFITSCVTDEKCRQNTYVQLIAGMYHVTKNQTTNTTSTSSLSLDSLTVKALKLNSTQTAYIYLDSILYNKSTSVSKIKLPLHKFENTSKYELKFNNTIDTLTFIHQNSDYYVSLECGCLKVHTIDTVLTTNHFIDSVKISNYNVNTTNAENIRIFK
jgi:hypothetical protein